MKGSVEIEVRSFEIYSYALPLREEIPQLFKRGEKRKGEGIFIQELKKKIEGEYLELDYDNPEFSLRKVKERLKKLSDR